MDLQRLKSAFQKLEALDDRETYRIRSRGSLSRLSVEQLEEKYRQLADYTVELKEILHEVILAVGSRPPAAKPAAGPPGGEA